jgi:hypothetical protein
MAAGDKVGKSTYKEHAFRAQQTGRENMGRVSDGGSTQENKARKRNRGVLF